MNLSITGKQIQLTDPIKNYIENALDSLNKYNLDIISTRVVINADEKNGKKGFGVELTINLPRTETIVIKQKDKDLYAAIDTALDRAHKVFRRHHDKLTTTKSTSSKESTSENNVNEAAIEGVDEIIPMELELYKPLEIEEALQRLKDSGMQFFVFNDIDAKMRVIYKRGDNKYGLY